MNGLFATRNVLFYCFVVMMMLRHIICMDGIFSNISINCKTYVVGYPCTIKCHVQDFKQDIAFFGPKDTWLGKCLINGTCSGHVGFMLKRNPKKKNIILRISELKKNHSGNWYCLYGVGNPFNIVKLRKVKDLPTERCTSRYLEVNEGESITLHCDFDFCTDCYVIKWYKDGIELQGNDTSYQVEFHSLTITKITQEDKGVYMCSVTESGFTIRNGPYIVIYSVRKKTIEIDPPPLTENPSPARNSYANTSQDPPPFSYQPLTENPSPARNSYANTSQDTPPSSYQPLTENPSPTRNSYANTSQGYAQIGPFWKILVWLLVLMFKFGFWLFYLWLFGPEEFYNISKSLFKEAAFLILLQRWIVVLGPALILISTPMTITVVEDASFFLPTTALFFATLIICRAVKRNNLIVSDSGNAEEQGCLRNRRNRTM